MATTGHDIGQRIGLGIDTGIGHSTGRRHRFFGSPAEVAAALAHLGSFTPGHVYGCQQTTGNLVNSAGSGTLTASSTSAGQFANATPFGNRKSLNFFDASGGYFIDPDVDVANPGTGSVAIVGIARLGVVGATRTWFSRLSGTNVGWLIQRYAGGIYMYTDDGAGGGAGVNHFHTGNPLPENGWCAFGFGYDAVALQAWCGVAADTRSNITRANISTLTLAGGTGRFTVGAATNRYEHDLAWLSVWTGSNANWYGRESDILHRLWRA
jgi:hypothetical protein